jgi:hypothetical protein
MKSRTEILDEAKRIVSGERDEQYGNPERSFLCIARLWSAYAGRTFTERDVAAMMALLKIARIASGKENIDNWVDLAGYAACGGEIDTLGSEGK